MALDQAGVVEERIPVRWVGAIGEAPPLEPHTIYAAHPRGFAGQMRRGPRLTRYFLEVDAADGLEDWPEQRIRDELSRRLGVGSRLDGVPLVTPTFVELRVRMTEPMQQGRVYLAGDAAHLITPAGGKGMNLAIQDAVELGHGLVERFGPAHRPDRLAGYSNARLPPSGGRRRSPTGCSASSSQALSAPARMRTGSRPTCARGGWPRSRTTRCWHAGLPTHTPASTPQPRRRCNAGARGRPGGVSFVPRPCATESAGTAAADHSLRDGLSGAY